MLRCPPHTAAGYRVYSNADLEQVRFIRRCQALGFSLDDIQQLSAMHGMAPAGCPDPGQVRRQFLELSRRRLAFLDGRIAGLKSLRGQIAALLRATERAPSGCPAAKNHAAQFQRYLGAEQPQEPESRSSYLARRQPHGTISVPKVT